MSTEMDQSLLDLTLPEIVKKLSFLNERYVRFWVNDADFRSEYRQLIDEGVKGKFNCFYRAAKNTLQSKRFTFSDKNVSGFDFETAKESIEAMERQMTSGRDDSHYDGRLLFMYKKISASYPSMRYWLTIPEFVSEMQSKIDNRENITDETVLEVMERIFQRKLELREIARANGSRVSFNFGLAKSAINKIRKVHNMPTC